MTKEKTLPFLTKDQILKADDLDKEIVEVPEWGGSVYVSMLTASERDDFEKTMIVMRDDGTAEKNMENFRANLCARTIKNQNGKRMFKTASDIQALGDKSAAAVERIFMVAMRLNKIGKKDVEDLTKN